MCLGGKPHTIVKIRTFSSELDGTDHIIHVHFVEIAFLFEVLIFSVLFDVASVLFHGRTELEGAVYTLSPYPRARLPPPFPFPQLPAHTFAKDGGGHVTS